ncbi:N-sulphoglucosamine sulphohydrolase-like [Anneissia japonica]|uniref:N-sulphoglucosamine sulphohydrolase-like n=1 Tax=Anneissia japonica TaxID=1529436 RepID=UPI001425B441|nr:N-sulphoglucosamine sulphohydrolase-like [Anneissia japonica]
MVPRSQVMLLLLIYLGYSHSHRNNKSRLDSKKNVLLIFVDDGGFESQVYNNSVCKTPNLAALAKRSVVLRRAYTSVSSCSPSRSALLTGLPQHQNGMYGLHHSFHHFNSFDEVKSIPLILKDHGIRTGIIGKKHIGPDSVYKFDYERTDEHYSMLQVARNITHMKELMREFLGIDDRPFFLYMAFKDVHRCDASIEKYGQFCERFGNGDPETGIIPDWKPAYYDPADVFVPYFLPDTMATRKEISAQYTAVSRMDQGVGLFLNELTSLGFLKNTLIIYTADNGIPFPNAKTNLYECGMGEPMMISSPSHTERWGQTSDALASTTDIVPTILEWFEVDFPSYSLNGATVELSGKSLLPILESEPKAGGKFDQVFSSHDLHEITMYYPMRVVRNRQYRLIHNINHAASYPIALDIFMSPTFQDMLNRTHNGEPTYWFKSLHNYYYRPEWELYDVTSDPHEKNNLIDNSTLTEIVQELKTDLKSWLEKTNDPWRCLPNGVLVGNACWPLYN